MVLEPVLVTVEPPSTAKLCAVPRDGAVWPSAGEGPKSSAANATLATRLNYVRFMLYLPLPKRVAEESRVPMRDRCYL